MSEVYKPFQPLLMATSLQSFGLSLQQCRPTRALAGIVHSFLQIRATAPTPYPVIPDGTQAIYISVAGAQLAGASTQSFDVQILEPGDYFGIRFYPAALRHFFNLDLSEITDQFADSHFLANGEFSRLSDRLYDCGSFRQRVSTCERWLLSTHKRLAPGPFDHALALICAARGNIRLGESLAARVGLSSRQLNRLFRQYTGLSSKRFAQIIRLQAACRQLYQQPGQGLQTALELGFCDQAHLLKDFKAHLRVSPSVFSRRFMSDFYNPSAV